MLWIGNLLNVMAVVMMSLILLVAVLHGDRLDTTLEFCLMFTVAAIPFTMLTVLSVTMAGVDVLCSDRTGTLTRNLHSLGAPIVCGAGPAGPVLLEAALASRRENDDTMR